MYRQLSAMAAGTLSAAFCFGQSGDTQKGAKALFIDSLTNQPMRLKKAEIPSVSRKQKTSSNKQAIVEVPAVTGLMFHVELLRTNGEVTQVNSSRVFHTGDRIRIHLNSNVTGNLVIFQSEDGSEPELLFPTGKLSGRVTKESEVVLPSSRAWFVFDEHPGQILLKLKLTADASEEPDQTPSPANDTETVVAAANSVHLLEEAQKGSKALKIEIDDSSVNASQVVVVDSRRDPHIQPGRIAVEIRLTHRS